MNNKITDIINGIDLNKAEDFVKTTKSNISVKTDIDKVTADTSWIDMVEESIPYLDNIIRNPRRFIIQEENIVPIEKTKVVTEESIRHLAQNTNLIQDVKKDGSVIPLKLLNVYREETVDLYENRFIKTLVYNLYSFVEDKLKESDQKSYAKVSNKVVYKAENKSKNETTNISLTIESRYDKEEINSKNGLSIEERIAHIRDVLAAFIGSQFIKSLKDSQPVRSPIRKTNVILKEQNFIKALNLWEYLEQNAIKPFTMVDRKTIDRSNEVKDNFDLAFYIQKDSLNLDEGKKDQKLNKINSNEIGKIINDIVFDNQISETEFKKIINKEFKAANKRKQKQEQDVKNCFANFLKDFEKKRQKAMSLLK